MSAFDEHSKTTGMNFKYIDFVSNIVMSYENDVKVCIFNLLLGIYGLVSNVCRR